MAKPELGTKRVCPETGRKFYDLNRDPIVSPYTGKSYPRSFFEETPKLAVAAKKVVQEEEVAEEEEEVADVEIVSLEEADKDTKKSGKPGKSDDLPDVDDDDDVEIDDDDDDDTFLADDDDDDDDVSDIIGVSEDDDDS